MSLYDSQGEAIQVWEGERDLGHVHPDLDYAYIDGLAADLASHLQCDVAEANYQPGDGTRYPLVIVPLFLLRAGRPRTSPTGEKWWRHAVEGVGGAGSDGQDKDGGDYYPAGTYLVAAVEGRCYPIRLRDRGSDLGGSYVAEHWGYSQTSAVSVAILLRAVAWYLDQWDAAQPLRAV